jgi:hypothetical protein
MKKLLIFLALFAIGLMAGAQSTYTYTATTVNDVRGHVWDYADTLVNSQTIDWIVRVKSPTVMDMEFQVVFDELSGAATGTLTVLGSNDGVTFITCSPTVSGTATADGSIWAKVTDFNYSYVKFLMTVTGTQTCTMKAYYSFRQE